MSHIPSVISVTTMLLQQLVYEILQPHATIPLHNRCRKFLFVSTILQNKCFNYVSQPCIRTPWYYLHTDCSSEHLSQKHNSL